jgi:TM2 domain-containing membrane protein YozV
MAFCTQCGSEVPAGNSFCEECGAEVATKESKTEAKYAGKSQTVAIVLAVFIGIFGIHRFYLGEMKKGVIYLIFSWTTITFFLGLYDAYKYYSNESDFEAGATTAKTKEQPPSDTQTPSVSAGSDDSDTVSKPDDAIIQIEGSNGTVTLYDGRIEISREDIGMIHRMQHGFSGTKEIPLESITSIQLRKPSMATKGYVQFGQKGYTEDDDGLLDATSDENTVLFEKDSLAAFEELREKIREMTSDSVQSTTGNMDGALEKLRERYANGEIDEGEYEERKEVLESS